MIPFEPPPEDVAERERWRALVFLLVCLLIAAVALVIASKPAAGCDYRPEHDRYDCLP